MVATARCRAWRRLGDGGAALGRAARWGHRDRARADPEGVRGAAGRAGLDVSGTHGAVDRAGDHQDRPGRSGSGAPGAGRRARAPRSRARWAGSAACRHRHAGAATACTVVRCTRPRRRRMRCQAQPSASRVTMGPMTNSDERRRAAARRDRPSWAPARCVSQSRKAVQGSGGTASWAWPQSSVGAPPWRPAVGCRACGSRRARVARAGRSVVGGRHIGRASAWRLALADAGWQPTGAACRPALSRSSSCSVSQSGRARQPAGTAGAVGEAEVSRDHDAACPRG